MNHIILIGRLTAVPELKTTTTGISVATATIAVDRGYGEEKKTDFIPVVFWRGLADTASKYCQKGMKIAVAGSLQTRDYTDKNGNKRKVFEVNVDALELPPKSSGVAFDPEPDDSLPF